VSWLQLSFSLAARFEGQLEGGGKRKKGREKEKKERYEGTEGMGAEYPLAEINFWL